MKSRLFFLIPGFLLIASACSTTRPAVDPTRDPTLVGAVSSAVEDGSEDIARSTEKGAETGRRIGTAVGVLSAIFGGGSHESLDESLDRFWSIRAAGEVIGATVGFSRAASKGWQRGHAFDIQMAELKKIQGIDVTRPAPDQIDIRFAYSAEAPLKEVACVIGSGELRSIAIEAPGDLAFAVREDLIDQGVPASLLESHRNQELADVVLHVRLLKPI